MIRPISHNDVERFFDRLADDAVEEAQKEHLRWQGQFTKAGGLQASRYPLMVEDSTRGILRKRVSAAMQLLTDTLARSDLPYEQIKGPALSRVINIGHRLANLVDEANRHMPTLDMNKIRAEYQKIIDHGISDFEVGMIDGKPAESTPHQISGDLRPAPGPIPEYAEYETDGDREWIARNQSAIEEMIADELTEKHFDSFYPGHYGYAPPEIHIVSASLMGDAVIVDGSVSTSARIGSSKEEDGMDVDYTSTFHATFHVQGNWDLPEPTFELILEKFDLALKDWIRPDDEDPTDTSLPLSPEGGVADRSFEITFHAGDALIESAGPGNARLVFRSGGNQFNVPLSPEIIRDFEGLLSRARSTMIGGGATEPDTDINAVPAADRFVGIDHNSTEFQEAGKALEELVAEVRGSNELSVNAEDRACILSEVQSLRELIKLPRVRVSVIVDATRESGILGWLAKEIGSGVIKALASKAIDLLLKLFG